MDMTKDGCHRRVLEALHPLRLANRLKSLQLDVASEEANSQLKSFDL